MLWTAAVCVAGYGIACAAAAAVCAVSGHLGDYESAKSQSRRKPRHPQAFDTELHEERLATC
jgi:hypothetical protein